MKTCDVLLDFMRTTESRLRTIIRWQDYKIVVTPRTYENLCRDTRLLYVDAVADTRNAVVFGCELQVDPKATDDFAFVGNGIKIAPYTEDEEGEGATP